MARSVLDDVKPGTVLTVQQSKALDVLLAQVLEVVANRRRGILLIHDSLQNTIGLFLQMFNWEVEYEVRFERGEWDPERMVFDIVATKSRQQMVIEVKDVISPRDLGQVWGYAKALQLSREKGRVYLGTDILNYGRLVTGTIGEMVKELMENERTGVILADKYVMVVFESYAQLTLQEMPQMLISEEAVG